MVILFLWRIPLSGGALSYILTGYWITTADCCGWSAIHREAPGATFYNLPKTPTTITLDWLCNSTYFTLIIANLICATICLLPVMSLDYSFNTSSHKISAMLNLKP